MPEIGPDNVRNRLPNVFALSLTAALTWVTSSIFCRSSQVNEAPSHENGPALTIVAMARGNLGRAAPKGLIRNVVFLQEALQARREPTWRRDANAIL